MKCDIYYLFLPLMAFDKKRKELRNFKKGKSEEKKEKRRKKREAIIILFPF